ncbi:hypothetical protein PsorP6_007262 [Peronosclerospora sorghi]|uniref:Uncharacterized protein n=1 Tax=Peronosclerospora sorghi TaxID=230839 RepID=A0ACC0WBU5_9STRA|nr:hypothetical protein PsorP6_007262 [Peronosclerospora sorghi]
MMDRNTILTDVARDCLLRFLLLRFRWLVTCSLVFEHLFSQSLVLSQLLETTRYLLYIGRIVLLRSKSVFYIFEWPGPFTSKDLALGSLLETYLHWTLTSDRMIG